MLKGPLKTLDSDCSKEEKQYAEWVTVRARVALLEARIIIGLSQAITTRPHACNAALAACTTLPPSCAAEILRSKLPMSNNMSVCCVQAHAKFIVYAAACQDAAVRDLITETEQPFLRFAGLALLRC